MTEPNDADRDYPFPSGTGDKDCPKCLGRGVIPADLPGFPGAGTQNCVCVFKRDLIANVARVWPVLLSVDSVEESPLLRQTRRSVWITASNYTFRRHLRYVAFRMGTQWDARVIADATLITAWLSTAKNVRDPDVLVARGENEAEGMRDTPSDHFYTLVDLAVPFDLLIIRLGVKAAKNREMPNVLAEAINERELLGKPTWVVDSPTKPLAPGHICYNDTVADMLDGFHRVILREESSAALAEGAQYAPKAVTQQQAHHPSAATSPSTPGLAAGKYTRHRESAYPTASATPTATTRVLVPAPLADDDEFSVDSLMTAAVDLQPEPGPGTPAPVEIPDAAFDLDEVIGDYPDLAAVPSNGMPSWLKGGHLTKEDREKAKGKKKWGKK